MGANDVVVLDSVTALRDWLRTRNLTSMGARWWAGKYPKEPVYPAGRITRVGGGTLEPCLDRPLIQIDIADAPGGSGSTVAGIAAEVTGILESLPPRTVIHAPVNASDTTLLLMGAHVVSNLDAPDPSTGAPRRALTVDLTTLAIPA